MGAAEGLVFELDRSHLIIVGIFIWFSLLPITTPGPGGGKTQVVGIARLGAWFGGVSSGSPLELPSWGTARTRALGEVDGS